LVSRSFLYDSFKKKNNIFTNINKQLINLNTNMMSCESDKYNIKLDYYMINTFLILRIYFFFSERYFLREN